MDTMIEYCLGFAFDDTLQNVVLIRKVRPEWQKGLLNGVGGKVEKEEWPHTAMIREFEEETGVRTHSWYTVGHLRGEDWRVFLFATTLSKEQLSNLKSTTDEIVVAYNTINSQDNSYDTIPNLMWLVPMAKYSLLKGEIFEINEISLQ